MADIKIDLNSIVTKAVKNCGLIEEKDKQQSSTEQLDEAYVATPKQYKQVTEFVSQKTKDSHTKLYEAYVKTLNIISSELDSVNKENANSRHSALRSLKLDESYNLNAVWLHELFFANCFDPQSELFMDTMSYMRLQRDFGTFDAWQQDFVACAEACGEGWAVCGYNMFLKRFVNVVISHHSGDVPLGFYPIIVLDMWSHSYFRDYLNDKSSYIVAQMRELNWNVIEDRFNKVEKIAGALK